MLQVAADALQAGDISNAQHADLHRWVNSEPCQGVKMATSERRLQSVASGISMSEGFPNSRVLAYYEHEGWYVIFTDASPGDERYLVFRGDPAQGLRPVEEWSGAFTMFETQELRDSLVRKAPEVPRKLADCIAWQVTLGQK
jgi:hypothetical protein